MTHAMRRLVRALGVRAAGALAVALCGGLLAGPAALAGTANAGLPGAPAGNPLAGMRWGVYPGFGNGLYPAFQTASGRHRSLLAKIARRPLAYWFGAWDSDGGAGASVRQYIQGTTGGDPRVLTQVVVFRLDPWEGCGLGYSAAAQRSYRNWVGSLAAGIGSARVALILQPDMPFSMCTSSSAPLQLVSYAARRFSALPHTTVYVDAGARYWPSFTEAVAMLERAGVRYARGFSLNTTEYDSTGAELEYGARLARALAGAGLPGKHFVINTAENGAPFLNGQYPGGNPANPRVCRNRHDHLCATLGIPPTWRVSAARWGLSGPDRGLAARYADAYLWIGRPWLDYGAGAFDLDRALQLAASSPF